MSRYHHPGWILTVILAAITLAGCQPAGGDFIVADVFDEGGKSLATAAYQPTTAPDQPEAAPTAEANLEATRPIPTLPPLNQLPADQLAQFAATPTSILSVPGDLELGTPGATPQPANCAEPPQPPFDVSWNTSPTAQAALGCAVGVPYTVEGAMQVFDTGFMFWRSTDRSIFAVDTSGTATGEPSGQWWRFDDTWFDGEAENDPTLSVPAGYQQPVRGIGKVWRENAIVREALGWATGGEYATIVQWQDFDKGWMIRLTDGGPSYAFIPNGTAPYRDGLHTGELR